MGLPALPAFVVATSIALAAQAPARIDPTRFLAHVKWLSADELGGRGNGTEGLERAAAYVRDRFRDAGLEQSDQPFDAEVAIDPPATAALLIADDGRRRTLALGRDYYPLSILDRSPATPPPAVTDAPVVFAGYGISAPALRYDDFAGVDVRDAAVLVMTHEPQEHDPRSHFDGRNLTPGAAIAQKARAAGERGARLLMVVEDPSHASDRATRSAWWTDPQSDNMGIPVARVARDQIAAAIDRTLQPQSRRLDRVRLSYVEYRSEQYTAAPPIALDHTRAMINLDMVGRARGRVFVATFGRLAGAPLLPRLRPWTRLAVQDFAGDGYSEEESDVGPFAKRGVPAVAFFTGFHSDYHRPTDDWPGVDAQGGAAVAELALKLIEDLAR
jgi:hypothetical protein